MTRLRILSLGAGVQSSVLALMAAHGEIPAPDAAIFADTGWEPTHVYTHLDWLETRLPFPVHRVGIGHRLQDRVRAGVRHDGSSGYIDIPKFQRNDDGSKSFNARRQCTSQYKIKPIRRKIRDIIGYPRQQPHTRRLAGRSAFRNQHGRSDPDAGFRRQVHPQRLPTYRPRLDPIRLSTVVGRTLPGPPACQERLRRLPFPQRKSVVAHTRNRT